MITSRVRFKRGLIPVLVGGLMRVAVPVGFGVAAGTVAQAIKAKPAHAAGETGNFSCSASVVRVELPPPTVLLEPFKANKPDNPCKADHQGLIGPTTAGPVTLSVASADTRGFDFGRTPGQPAGVPPNPSTCLNADGTRPTPGPCADAVASVADVGIVAGGAAIRARVLTAEAHGRCLAGQPQLSGDSRVLSLSVNGTSIDVPAAKNTNVAGIITLREETTSPTGDRVTERALDVFIPGVVRVIVAEATVDVKDNPCVPPTTCPPDNDADDNLVAPPSNPTCECPPLTPDADDASAPCGGTCPTGTHANPLFPPTNPPCCPNEADDDDTEEAEPPSSPPGACVCEEADDEAAEGATDDESAETETEDVPEVPCCPPDGDSDDGQLTTEENESCECPPVTPDADDTQATADDDETCEPCPAMTDDTTEESLEDTAEPDECEAEEATGIALPPILHNVNWHMV